MIIDKKVRIKIKNKIQINSILNMGFKDNLKINSEILLPIEYLSYNSHVLINVKCDNCKTKKQIKYQSYNKVTNNGKTPYY